MNPSREIAKALDGRRAGGLAVRALVLPVEHEARPAGASPPPSTLPGLAAVLHLGLAGGRARIALEQVGVNVMDYPIPDARRPRRDGRALRARRARRLLATLPMQRDPRRARRRGRARVPLVHGGHVPLQLRSTPRSTRSPRAAPPPAGFIHLPFLPAMVAAHGLDEPSMDLGLMLRAVEIALAVIAASARDGTEGGALLVATCSDSAE